MKLITNDYTMDRSLVREVLAKHVVRILMTGGAEYDAVLVTGDIRYDEVTWHLEFKVIDFDSEAGVPVPDRERWLRIDDIVELEIY